VCGYDGELAVGAVGHEFRDVVCVDIKRVRGPFSSSRILKRTDSTAGACVWSLSSSVSPSRIRSTTQSGGGNENGTFLISFPHFHPEVQHQAVSAAERVAETAKVPRSWSLDGFSGRRKALRGAAHVRRSSGRATPSLCPDGRARKILLSPRGRAVQGGRALRKTSADVRKPSALRGRPFNRS